MFSADYDHVALGASAGAFEGDLEGALGSKGDVCSPGGLVVLVPFSASPTISEPVGQRLAPTDAVNVEDVLLEVAIDRTVW